MCGPSSGLPGCSATYCDWAAGVTSVGGMSAGTLQNSAGGCAISASSAKWVGGTSYTITITVSGGSDATPKQVKIVSDGGTLSGLSGGAYCQYQTGSDSTTTTSVTATWTAPSAGYGTVTLKAICGNTNAVYLSNDFAFQEAPPPTHSPITVSPVTLNPTTLTPTYSRHPVTAAPVTLAPTDTYNPTTESPVTGAPSSLNPTACPTISPTTGSPVTVSPTTQSPITGSPATLSPATAAPTETTLNPTSASPTRSPSTTRGPLPGGSTWSPITISPSASPSTLNPITASPATASPATVAPTKAPSRSPATGSPATAAPTKSPATGAPSRSPSIAYTGPTLIPTASPSGAPSTAAPSSAVFSVTLTISGVTLASANSTWRTNFESGLATYLSVSASSFSVSYTSGSLIANVFFLSASGGTSAASAAQTLSASTPAQLTAALGVTVSVVSSTSTGTGDVTSKCYSATLPSAALSAADAYAYMCSGTLGGGKMKVSWSHTSTDIALELRAQVTGYVALGYSTDGTMLGGGSSTGSNYADIGWCTGNPAMVPSGGEYFLGNKTSAGIQIVQGVALTNVKCVQSVGGETVLRFQRPLAVASTFSISTEGDTRVIWSMSMTDGVSVGHNSTSRGSGYINFGTGGFKEEEDRTYLLYHSVCMWIGFCLFLWSGVACARHRDEYSKRRCCGRPRWLSAHITVNSIAIVFIAGGYYFAALYRGDEKTEYMRFVPELALKTSGSLHGTLGALILLLIINQIILGACRPRKNLEKKTCCRGVWRRTHRCCGTFIVYAAFANVFWGMTLYGSALAFKVLHGFWTGLCLVLDLFGCYKDRGVFDAEKSARVSPLELAALGGRYVVDKFVEKKTTKLRGDLEAAKKERDQHKEEAHKFKQELERLKNELKGEVRPKTAEGEGNPENSSGEIGSRPGSAAGDAGADGGISAGGLAASGLGF